MSHAWTRRQFLASGAVLPAGSALASVVQPASSLGQSNPSSPMPHVIVVGAGAFGGWTAFHLQRLGARVTLIDAWGPGNSRSSSGGDTRVIRAVYGPDRIYHQMVARSFQIWKEVQERWKQSLYRPSGALWMFASGDSYVRSSLPHAREAGFRVDELSRQEARQRFPQIDFEGIRSVFFEQQAGYLLARRACRSVWEQFQAQGGEFRQELVRPPKVHNGRLDKIDLEGGQQLRADAFVFACGPWLGRLFPEGLKGAIRPTRQPVFYFGTPPGEPKYSEEHLPVWVEFGPRVVYGIPGAEGRGFKWADDTRGSEFDPDQGERLVTLEEIRSARRHLARRFPGLAGAPLLESRVCQYENSPDGHFILDRHPQAENLWLAGGGSGHGFKLGPAVGEHLALRILGRAEPEPFFSLSRLQGLEGSPATQIGVRKKP